MMSTRRRVELFPVTHVTIHAEVSEVGVTEFGLYDARWFIARVFRQESAFRGLDNEKQCLGVISPKKRKFWGPNRHFSQIC